MPEPISTPQTPVGVQTTDVRRERAQFQALKRSLNDFTSWELAGASWDEGIVMKFSENFPDEKAKLFLIVIG